MPAAVADGWKQYEAIAARTRGWLDLKEVSGAKVVSGYHREFVASPTAALFTSMTEGENRRAYDRPGPHWLVQLHRKKGR